jgi:hypothetical protein
MVGWFGAIVMISLSAPAAGLLSHSGTRSPG